MAPPSIIQPATLTQSIDKNSKVNSNSYRSIQVLNFMHPLQAKKLSDLLICLGDSCLCTGGAKTSSNNVTISSTTAQKLLDELCLISRYEPLAPLPTILNWFGACATGMSNISFIPVSYQNTNTGHFRHVSAVLITVTMAMITSLCSYSLVTYRGSMLNDLPEKEREALQGLFYFHGLVLGFATDNPGLSKNLSKLTGAIWHVAGELFLEEHLKPLFERAGKEGDMIQGVVLSVACHETMVACLAGLRLVVQPESALEITLNLLATIARRFDLVHGQGLKRAYCHTLTTLLTPLLPLVSGQAEVNIPAWTKVIEQLLLTKALAMQNKPRYFEHLMPLLVILVALSRQPTFMKHYPRLINSLINSSPRLIMLNHVLKLWWVFCFKYADSWSALATEAEHLQEKLFFAPGTFSGKSPDQGFNQERPLRHAFLMISLCKLGQNALHKQLGPLLKKCIDSITATVPRSTGSSLGSLGSALIASLSFHDLLPEWVALERASELISVYLHYLSRNLGQKITSKDEYPFSMVIEPIQIQELVFHNDEALNQIGIKIKSVPFSDQDGHHATFNRQLIKLFLTLDKHLWSSSSANIVNIDSKACHIGLFKIFIKCLHLIVMLLPYKDINGSITDEVIPLLVKWSFTDLGDLTDLIREVLLKLTLQIDRIKAKILNCIMEDGFLNLENVNSITLTPVPLINGLFMLRQCCLATTSIVPELSVEFITLVVVHLLSHHPGLRHEAIACLHLIRDICINSNTNIPRLVIDELSSLLLEPESNFNLKKFTNAPTLAALIKPSIYKSMQALATIHLSHLNRHNYGASGGSPSASSTFHSFNQASINSFQGSPSKKSHFNTLTGTSWNTNTTLSNSSVIQADFVQSSPLHLVIAQWQSYVSFFACCGGFLKNTSNQVYMPISSSKKQTQSVNKFQSLVEVMQCIYIPWIQHSSLLIREASINALSHLNIDYFESFVINVWIPLVKLVSQDLRNLSNGKSGVQGSTSTKSDQLKTDLCHSIALVLKSIMDNENITEIMAISYDAPAMQAIFEFICELFYFLTGVTAKVLISDQGSVNVSIDTSTINESPTKRREKSINTISVYSNTMDDNYTPLRTWFSRLLDTFLTLINSNLQVGAHCPLPRKLHHDLWSTLWNWKQNITKELLHPVIHHSPKKKTLVKKGHHFRSRSSTSAGSVNQHASYTGTDEDNLKTASANYGSKNELSKDVKVYYSSPAIILKDDSKGSMSIETFTESDGAHVVLKNSSTLNRLADALDGVLLSLSYGLINESKDGNAYELLEPLLEWLDTLAEQSITNLTEAICNLLVAITDNMKAFSRMRSLLIDRLVDRAYNLTLPSSSIYSSALFEACFRSRSIMINPEILVLLSIVHYPQTPALASMFLAEGKEIQEDIGAELLFPCELQFKVSTKLAHEFADPWFSLKLIHEGCTRFGTNGSQLFYLMIPWLSYVVLPDQQTADTLFDALFSVRSIYSSIDWMLMVRTWQQFALWNHHLQYLIDYCLLQASLTNSDDSMFFSIVQAITLVNPCFVIATLIHDHLDNDQDKQVKLSTPLTWFDSIWTECKDIILELDDQKQFIVAFARHLTVNETILKEPGHSLQERTLRWALDGPLQYQAKAWQTYRKSLSADSDCSLDTLRKLLILIEQRKTNFNALNELIKTISAHLLRIKNSDVSLQSTDLMTKCLTIPGLRPTMIIIDPQIVVKPGYKLYSVDEVVIIIESVNDPHVFDKHVLAQIILWTGLFAPSMNSRLAGWLKGNSTENIASVNLGDTESINSTFELDVLTEVAYSLDTEYLTIEKRAESMSRALQSLDYHIATSDQDCSSASILETIFETIMWIVTNFDNSQLMVTSDWLLATYLNGQLSTTCSNTWIESALSKGMLRTLDVLTRYYHQARSVNK